MLVINTHRKPPTGPTGDRVDPTVVREPTKPGPICLACASRSRVAQHNCGIRR